MAETNNTSDAYANGHLPTSTDTSYTVPLLINGLNVTTPTTHPITSPLTSLPIHRTSSASPEHAHSAITAASTALPSWRLTTPSTRRTILLRAASLMLSRSSTLQQFMEQETGSAPTFATFNITTAASMLEDIASRLLSVLTSTSPISQDETRRALVIKEPIGVVLAIAPWNAPYILGTRAIASALAGGNTVVLKGSEISPRCFFSIGEILNEAGLPPGVLNVIYTRPEEAAEVTSAMIKREEVRKVSFTGSTAVGRKIAEICGRELKPCLMELGGKAPAIVCEDAEVEGAARGVALGAFLHAGQVCMSTERVVVQEGVLAEFKEVLGRVVGEIFGGKEEEGLVLSGEGGVRKNRLLVEDAVGKGAKLVVGEVGEGGKAGTRMRPIVMEGVREDMDVYYTESFGPTVSIVTYKEEEEAVRIANDTEYGLNAAVFTRDLAKGMRIARQIEAGNVHINSMSIHDEPNLPHGGVKKSGWGRFNADKGIEEFLVSKTVTWKE